MLYKKLMEKPKDDRFCFVCGPENELGLRLDFVLRKDVSQAELVFPAHLCGWQDIVHGGIIATVLDEAMAKAALSRDWHCLTAEMSVKFKIPCRSGQPYTLRGAITATRGRLVMAQSELLDRKNKTVASASGKLCKI